MEAKDEGIAMADSVLREEEQYKTEDVPTLWDKHKIEIIMLVLLLVAWFFFRGKRGITTADNMDITLIAVILGIFMWKSTIWGFKVASPKVIFNGGHSTFDGNIYKFGPWRAIRLGGYKVAGDYGFIGKGRDGTILFPHSCLLPRGESADLAVSARMISIEELPARLRTTLLQRSFPKPFYIGITDEKVFLDNPDLNFMLDEYLETNKWNARLQQIVEEVMDVKEQKKGFMDRLRDRYLRGRE